MAIAQYASLRSQLPAPTVTVPSGGFLSGSGTLYFSLQARNRCGHNLPSFAVSATYSAGDQIEVTIPATARAAGEEIHRFVLSAGATTDTSTHRQLAIYEGFEDDQETLEPLPVVITFSQDEHLVLGGIVSDLASLPSGSNLLNGMLREVTTISKILRYEEASTAVVDNITVYSASPNLGRWTVYGSFSTYQESTSDPGGCDRPISLVPEEAFIFPSTHPADGSTGTPVGIWLISDRSEGASSVPQGKRIGFNVYQNGLNKSVLFDAQLLLTLNGFVRLSDGTLDTSGLTTDETTYRYGKEGAQILEKDLPSGYALSYNVAIAVDQSELNEPIPVDTPIRVQPFFYAQSGAPNATANFTGDVIFGTDDRRRIVAGDSLSIRALAGSGTIAGVTFPTQSETVVTGLASNMPAQPIAINGDGVVTIESNINDLRVTQRLRAYVSTVDGVSNPGTWSAYGAVSAGQELTVTLSHPTDGTNGAIRADYPDPAIAGNSKGEFNPVSLRVYIQRQSDGEIREFNGFVVVNSVTQEITISTWADGVVVGQLPSAANNFFSLFTPGSSTFIASGGGGDFSADSYRVTFSYDYDGGQVTAIDHSNPPAIYEAGSDVAGWDQTATEWANEKDTLARLNAAQVYTRAQRSQPFNLSIASGVVAIDCSESNTFLLLLTENVTSITFSNLFAGASFDIQISQDGTGGRTISWPAAVTWAGANALTPSPGANAVDVVSFKSFDGTTLRGAIAQGFA